LQVLKLDEDFGHKLFDRWGRSARLTEAGHLDLLETTPFTTDNVSTSSLNFSDASLTKASRAVAAPAPDSAC